MKVYILSVVIALFIVGAGGKLAYDDYREHERQKMSEALSSSLNCSSCAAHKADLKRMREYNVERSLLEEQPD